MARSRSRLFVSFDESSRGWRARACGGLGQVFYLDLVGRELGVLLGQQLLQVAPLPPPRVVPQPRLLNTAPKPISSLIGSNTKPSALLSALFSAQRQNGPHMTPPWLRIGGGSTPAWPCSPVRSRPWPLRPRAAPPPEGGEEAVVKKRQ